MPEALLEIADRGGPEAEAILKKFPPPNKVESLGTVQGNLSAALAKLGDPKEFAGITERPPINEIQELEYIGGRKAVEALIGILQTPSQHSSAETAWLASCTQKYGAPSCNSAAARDDRNFQAVLTAVLTDLAHMVKDPPLPSNADPTSENIQKWRDWWARNKDTAQFVPNPIKGSQLQ